MHDRSALGPADVTDAELTAMVAALLDADPGVVEVTDSHAVEFPYDLPAITTAGRYWVSGTARVAGRDQPFRMFVKHIQSWVRHPLFEQVPREAREMAAQSVPWRTEALAYASDLRDRLPDGLSMPRALGVFDLDELANAVWLEEVPVVDRAWDLPRFAHTARLLGRLAVSADVEPLRDVGEFGFEVHTYLHGRLAMQVLPMVRDEGIWHHPLVAGAFDDDLRARLLDAADRMAAYVDELAALPRGSSHGDACPNNLLSRTDSDDVVLIDYGYWAPNAVGHDLGQLLVGDVQLGKGSADSLHEIDETIVPAYLEGMRAEGSDIPADVVRRAHAVQLLVFTGISTLPFEHLDRAPTPELHEDAAQRAKIARFSLDLVDATA